jgi:hypothetical protein
VAHPQIAAFARLANGSVKPTRSIAGQQTLITRTIHDMAYDSVRDEIVVPQFFAFAILTFRGDTNGNVAPVRKIFGPSTQIKLPQAVAVDAIHGEIFVPQDDNRVLVFPRDANGDAAPIRILETDSTPFRVTVDPVHDLLIVSGGPMLRIYDRKANGKARPRSVITIPNIDPNVETRTRLLATNPASGMIFATVLVGGRYALEDYVAVWNINDSGETAPRFTIGGPGTLLKDVRGVAIDAKNKHVIVSDKTLNAVMTFHVPEVF